MNEHKKEYQVINLFFEYGRCIEGCKYAIASDWSEEELRMRFPEEIQDYSPFIYLTAAQGEAIIAANRNDACYRMRSIRSFHGFGYSDGESELFHPEIAVRDVQDVFMEGVLHQEVRLLFNEINEVQRRRIWKNVVCKMSERDIAEEEGVTKNAVHKSISQGLKKMKKKIDQG